jgi:starch-binding outer membrane protein, SusD/RagB family
MKNMKKATFSLAIFLSLLTVVGGIGCGKELNEEPFNAISASDAFNSPERIDKSAVGMYDQLQNSNFFGGRILVYADIRGVDASPASSFFGDIGLFHTLKSDNNTVALAWQGAYRTIYEANLFLKNFAPNAGLVSPAKADQYVGEAKFIRSLCYFYLVNLWAQPYSFTADAGHPGVPLVLEAAADPFASSNAIPRAFVKAVYGQMEQDLLEAEAKLPLTYSDDYTRTSRATKGAARALLMRLYLYKGDYAKAAAYAKTIMDSGVGYALQGAPQTPFRTYTTKESIFSVAMDGGDNPNTNNALGQHYSAARRGDIPVSTDYVNLMDTTVDLRYKNLVQKVSGSFWTTKYNAGVTDWVPVFRYAEVLLTRAEALAQLAAGTAADTEATGLLNQVRARSNAGAVNPATKEELLNLIYRERRIELAFEGQGILEFLRTKRDIPAHSGVVAQSWGSDYVVLPIPKYDTDKNPQLEQNDGY